MRTATVVFLGRRREALSSTTRNQSSSQLQKGANQNRGSPTLNRDENPCWVWENPPQLAQELICTKAVFFLNQNHHIYYRIADPCWDWENPLQLPTFSSSLKYKYCQYQQRVVVNRVGNWHFNDMHNAHCPFWTVHCCENIFLTNNL